MKYTKKTKKPSQVRSRTIAYGDAERDLLEALKAEPKDIKVPISLRLDGDIYLELKRLAEKGVGDGKYQKILNKILRHHLFDETIPSTAKVPKKASGD